MNLYSYGLKPLPETSSIIVKGFGIKNLGFFTLFIMTDHSKEKKKETLCFSGFQTSKLQYFEIFVYRLIHKNSYHLLSTNCRPSFVLSALHVYYSYSHNHPLRQALLSPCIIEEENLNSEKLSDLPKVTQGISREPWE